MNDRALVQVVLPGIVEPEDLQVRYAPLPEPGPGQLVIAMEATGVSFAEQQMRRGRYEPLRVRSRHQVVAVTCMFWCFS